MREGVALIGGAWKTGESGVLREFLHTGHLPIGVDISPSGVKMVQLRRRRRGGCGVLAASRHEFSPAESEGDLASRLALATDVIARKIESGGFIGANCVLGVEHELLRVRSVRQPKMTSDETDKALRLDGAERLGFEEGVEAQIGWLHAGEVRQGEDARDELIVIGAPTKPLEAMVEAVSAAGLRPIAIEPSFIACGRTFSRAHRRASDQASVRIVVDVGLRSTGVVILRGADVVFFKQLSAGGAQLTSAAGERLGLDLETVADLRGQRMRGGGKAGGESSDEKVDRAIYDAVRPLLEELASEVSLCARYYTVTFRGSRPEQAILAGDHAQEPGLAEIVSAALGVACVVGAPLDGMDIADSASHIDRRGALPELATAAGLSIRAEPALYAAQSGEPVQAEAAPAARRASGLREAA